MGEWLWHIFQLFGDLALIVLGASTLSGAIVAILIFGALWIASWHRRSRKEGKLGVEVHHLVLFGLCGGIFCLIVAASAYSYILYTAPKAAQTTGNPLWDKVAIFTAKNGKKAIPGPSLGDRGANFAMGDESDGRGPTITSWDSSLGPWPTTEDGFRENEVRLLPRRYPHFSTQHDREELRKALGSIVNMVQQSEEMVSAAIVVHRGVPKFVPRWQDLDALLTQIAAVRTRRAQIAAQLGITGQPLELLIPKYPLVQDELVSILPPSNQTIEIWNSFEKSLNGLAGSIETFRDSIKNHPEDANLHNQLLNIVSPYAFEFSKSTTGVRDWNVQARRRIEMVRKAI